ncbi:MAG TPA: alpha/beta fold hydrolase [bacterium]|nr:alpha/beta fold hydrolase [bacterium]
MRSKNSTNVRFTEAFYRAGFRVFGTLLPPLAAARAEKIFRTPPFHPVSEEENRVLARAKKFRIPTKKDVLAVYQWGDGQGPMILLVHGWGGSAGQFHPLIDPLLEAGYSVLAFDAPAHGDSSGELSSLPQFAEAVRRVADWAGPLQGILTHSMGGAAASMALAEGLQVDRAVFIAPPADAYDWFRKFSQRLGFSKDLAERTRRRMEERLHFDFAELNADVIGPRISTPILILHDRQDKEVSWEDAQRVAHASPHVRLISTQGLGHRRILKSPAVIQAALEFLGGKEEIEALPVHALSCEGCGNALKEEEGRYCEECELDFELAHPAARWAHLE